MGVDILEVSYKLGWLVDSLIQASHNSRIDRLHG